MSAMQIRLHHDWRVRRAIEAIKANPFPAQLDYDFYSAEFELDRDDVIEVFMEAATVIGEKIWIQCDPVPEVLH